MAPVTISSGRVAHLLRATTPAARPGLPAYQGIAEGLRRLVADGRILDGTRLPSERDLTAALGVSRTTVAGAYAVLRARGYLASRRGSGSVVTVPGGPPSGGPLHPSDGLGEVVDLSLAAPSAPPGMVEIFEEAVAGLAHHVGGSGYHPFGLAQVRERVAARYGARGLPTDPDQIILTTGALAGLSLALRGFIGPSDRVLMESPTYPNAIAAVRDSGARTVGLPLDPAGLDPHALELALRQSAARLAYLIPDFQNPTGVLVDEDTRALVGRALRRQAAVALVDETPAELLIDIEEAAMPRPLAAFDDRVVTLGSASKTFWGGLRVGWVRAPMSDVPRLQRARLSLDLGVPVVEQLVLATLLERQDIVLEHRRAQLRHSRDALVTALHDRLPDWRFTVPSGGLSLWCELPAPRSTALCDAALPLGIRLAPGSAFGVGGGLESFVRVPFALEAEVLVGAVDGLARAWRTAVEGPVRPAARASLIA